MSTVTLMETENVVEDSAMIDNLDDDLLMSIFHYLPPKDLIKIEQVSKRWRDVSRKTWSLIPNKKFDITPNCFSSSFSTDHIIEQLFQRCGKYVTDICFCLKNIDHSEDILTTVAAHFPPYLRKCGLSDMHVSAASLKAIADKCQKIEWLYLFNVTGDLENGLAELLANNRQLRNIILVDMMTITGKCLTAIEGERIEEVMIVNCKKFDFRHLTSSEKLAKSVKNISLGPCGEVAHLDTMSALTNLTVLELFFFPTTNQLLSIIGRRCRFLKDLTIYSLDSDFNACTLEPVLKLPLLERLWISGLKGRMAWRQIQCVMHCLTRLELSDDKLTDLDIVNLVKLSPKLNLLVLNDCDIPVIEDKWLEQVLKVIQKRGDDIKLEIQVAPKYCVRFQTRSIKFDRDSCQILKK